MKKIMRGTRYLLFASMIFIMTIAISCKKNSLSDVAGPGGRQDPGPVEITYYSPYYGSPGDTITIFGYNLKTTKSVSFAGIPATSFKIVQDTLKAVLGPFSGDSIVKRGPVEIRTDSSGNLVLPYSEFQYYPSRIEGYVASWELLYKFYLWEYNSFEFKDSSINNGIPNVIQTGASYSKAVIGNGLELDNGYYQKLIFNYGSAYNLWRDWGDGSDCCTFVHSSFSLSLWLKTSSSPDAAGSVVQIVGSNTGKIWGPVQLGAAMGYHGDTLALETRYSGLGSGGAVLDDYQLQDPRTNSDAYIAGTGKWNLIVLTFNDTTRTLSLYANGILISGRTLTGFEKSYVFTNEDVYLLLGTPAFKENGFLNSDPAADHTLYKAGITASIDELALMEYVMKPEDILTLYHLGKAGR
jgi:Concanavalin A-like lectin/glucanases superfamily